MNGSIVSRKFCQHQRQIEKVATSGSFHYIIILRDTRNESAIHLNQRLITRNSS